MNKLGGTNTFFCVFAGACLLSLSQTIPVSATGASSRVTGAVGSSSSATLDNNITSGSKHRPRHLDLSDVYECYTWDTRGCDGMNSAGPADDGCSNSWIIKGSSTTPGKQKWLIDLSDCGCTNYKSGSRKCMNTMYNRNESIDWKSCSSQDRSWNCASYRDCLDSTKNIKLKVKGKKKKYKCKKISEKGLCEKKSRTGALALEYCPKACGMCGYEFGKS